MVVDATSRAWFYSPVLTLLRVVPTVLLKIVVLFRGLFNVVLVLNLRCIVLRTRSFINGWVTFVPTGAMNFI